MHSTRPFISSLFVAGVLATLPCACRVQMQRPPPPSAPEAGPGPVAAAPAPAAAPRVTWDDPREWMVNRNNESTCALATAPGPGLPAIRFDYTLGGAHGWIELKRPVTAPPPDAPISLLLKAAGQGDLELKLVDRDGSVFGRRVPLAGRYADWTRLVLYPANVEYWWSGQDDQFSELQEFMLAVAGRGSGTLWIAAAGFDQPGLPATFPPAGPFLDPNRELPGLGFRQRRAAELIPEDPLVLEWMKQLQDTSAPDRRLLPSMEDNECHTFNSALAAMAFLVKGERERAERILDFFASATRRDNRDPTLQNFFLNGEARGFFQAVALNPEKGVAARHTVGPNDRWMGDMAWRLLAYQQYAARYGPDRYREIVGLLKGLLDTWYRDAPDGPGGYVQHGWRKGDSRLHENGGHPEGNIDAFAAFKASGDEQRAGQIKTWLDRVCRAPNLPLDLYTWRALAFGPDYLHVLDIPEYDLRYRKSMTINGREVMGFYDHADINITNIWLDGVGHIACGYFAGGNIERGNFYANQLDAFLMEREINGVRTRALPYAANHSGGYEWVKLDRGALSAAAWYIFAKNHFNPMIIRD